MKLIAKHIRLLTMFLNLHKQFIKIMERLWTCNIIWEPWFIMKGSTYTLSLIISYKYNWYILAYSIMDGTSLQSNSLWMKICRTDAHVRSMLEVVSKYEKHNTCLSIHPTNLLFLYQLQLSLSHSSYKNTSFLQQINVKILNNANKKSMTITR